MEPRRKTQVELPGYMSLSWDRDRLRAYVTFMPTENQPVGPGLFNEVVSALEAAGLKNVDTDAVKKALANVNPGKPVLVATGTPPSAGRDGYIDYKVKVDTEMMELAEDDYGRIDYRELSLFDNVHAGQVLAVVVDPKKGNPGTDVFGHPVPPEQGRAARLRVGRNVEVTEEGKCAKATSDGMPCLVRDRLEVLPVYKVREDVSYATGHIRFVGDVHVGRSVLEDFLVAADENVFIEHSIEKASVTAGENIEVGRGIYGKENVAVSAGGNLKAGFANNADLRAGGEICIDGEVLWCNCEADVIRVEGYRSSVKGGVHRAHSGMTLSQVGDPRSTVKTELIVQPSQDTLDRIETITKELEHIRSEAKGKVERMQGFRNVTESYREKAKEQLTEWKSREKELQDELAELQATLDRSKEGEIVVTGDVYPGTKVVIGDAEREIRSALRAVVFRYKDGKIDAADIGRRDVQSQ